MKSDQRVQLTKRLLREALLKQMNEKPFAQISVKGLCDEAGLNRTTFYLHYQTTEDLLREIEDGFLQDFTDALKEVKPNIDRLSYLEELLGIVEKNQDVVLALAMSGLSPEYPARFLSAGRGLVEQNVQLDFPEDLKPYVYGFLIHGCLDILKIWLREGCRTPRHTVAKLIYSLSDNALEASEDFA